MRTRNPCLLSIYLPRRALQSFPTRRSSDLRPSGKSNQPQRRPRLARGYPSSSNTSGNASNASSSNLSAVLMHKVCCTRSEEHTSELQSPCNLVCRLLLEKKNVKKITIESFK